MIPFNTAFWQNSEIGINPISLGQPVVYFQSFDTSSTFINPANPAPDQQITSLSRYDDGSFTTVSAANTDRRRYLAPTNSQNLKPYGVVLFGGLNLSVDSNQRAWFGDTSTLAFMTNPNFAYSIYLVYKPRTPDLLNSIKYIFSTAPNTTGTSVRGVSLGISQGGVVDTQVTVYNVRIGGNQLYSSLGMGDRQSTINSFNDQPLRLISIRAFDGNLSDPSLWLYLNGVFSQTRTKIIDITTTANTQLQPTFAGLRNSTANLGLMNLGEFIIFNEFHSEDTHNKINQFLMNKWQIT
jgi:hypothetical protein